MKCANCSADAVFTDSHPGLDSVNYCNTCLPNHLRSLADAGRLALQDNKPETPKAKPAKSEAKETPAKEE